MYRKMLANLAVMATLFTAPWLLLIGIVYIAVQVSR